jgi:hypothetical protein
MTTNPNNVHGIHPRNSIRQGPISSTHNVPSILGCVKAYVKQKFASELHVGVLSRRSRDIAEEISCIRG